MKQYRPARLDDTPAIATLSIQGWRHAYTNILPADLLASLDPTDRANSRRTFLQDNALSTHVCTQADNVVAFVDYELCRDEDCGTHIGEIWAIYVHPDLIGTGIGSALLSIAADDLRARDCTELHVWVLRDNQQARHFYERRGFVLDGAERPFRDLIEVRYARPLV